MATATDPSAISGIAQSLAAYRAGNTSAPAASATAAPSSTPVAPAPAATPVAPASTNDSIAQALSSYRASRDSGTAAPAASAIPKDDPNALASFAKGVFGAIGAVGKTVEQPIISLAAKPVQYIAKGLGLPDPYAAAPVPSAFGDVTPSTATLGHTAGDALQVGSLFTGNPALAGAAIGAGNSLEQGNNLLSIDTLAQTALGAAGGQVLGWLGKPLLDAAGKTIGVITPDILKSTIAKGTDAVAQFASEHNLPFKAAVDKVTAPVIDTVSNAADKVAQGVQTAKKAVAGQFPGLNPTQHYLDVNARDLELPTKTPGASYNKATAIFNDAKNRGIDLAQTANERGIAHHDISSEGKYDTKDTADALRQANFDVGKQTLRPALKAIEPGVQNVPISQVRGALLKNVHDTPASQLDDDAKAALVRKINTKYSEGSAADTAHPNGYSLTDLHDSRIEAGLRGKFKPGVTTTPTSANLARSEGRVFKNLFDRNVPADSGLDAVRKESEKNFMLADYLDALHGKNIPEGVTKKAVRIFGRGIGGAIGSKVGGFPGFLVGSRGGDMLFSSFETLPNPIKSAVLTKAFENRSTSPVFDSLNKYLGEKETARLLQKALPAAGESSFKETSPTLFTTPGGKSTPSKSEAIDLTAVENQVSKPPKGLSGIYNKKK
jgi:hypothetical protein